MLTFNLNIIPRVKGAYIVGGSIRDILANKIPNDYDFVVEGPARDFAHRIAEKTNGHVLTLGKPEFSLYRVTSGVGIFDVSSVSGETIQEDLSKRDFTVNAMAVEIIGGKLVDPYDGLKDLKNRTIRMVAEQAFVEDPARLLRAYRLVAQFDFSLEKKTQEAIKRYRLLIKNIAGERVHTELITILKTYNSIKSLRLMIESGMLFAIIPELSVLSGLTGNDQHDVVGPEIDCYEKMEAILAKPYAYIYEENAFTESLGENAGLLKFAVLLANILNPERRIGIPGAGSRCLFSSIEVETSTVAAICERLRFSKDEKRYLCHVIGSCQIPEYLYSLVQNRDNAEKAISRFFYKCKDSVPDIALFALARHKGPVADCEGFADFIQQLLKNYYEKFVPLYHLKPLLTGEDLISEFSLTPSPGFELIFEQIREARLDGRITSREDALEMVKMIIS